MEVKQKAPNGLEYPYLAVMNRIPEKCVLRVHHANRIFLISKVDDGTGGEIIYAHRVIGGMTGTVVNDENCYTPLPSGYEITLKQS